jgi:hypothetical protein
MRAGFSFELSGSDIHIWTLPTEASNDVAALFESVLVTDETDCAISVQLPTPFVPIRRLGGQFAGMALQLAQVLEAIALSRSFKAPTAFKWKRPVSKRS